MRYENTWKLTSRVFLLGVIMDIAYSMPKSVSYLLAWKVISMLLTDEFDSEVLEAMAVLKNKEANIINLDIELLKIYIFTAGQKNSSVEQNQFL